MVETVMEHAHHLKKAYLFVSFERSRLYAATTNYTVTNRNHISCEFLEILGELLILFSAVLIYRTSSYMYSCIHAKQRSRQIPRAKRIVIFTQYHMHTLVNALH